MKLSSILTSGSGEEEMPFKDVSSSGSPFIQWSGTICEILVEGIMRRISVLLFFFQFGQVVQEELLFKRSYLELWRLSCSMDRNHLNNFGRGHYGRHSCEII